MDLATPDAFHNDPSLVWQFYAYRRHSALRAKPNAGHYALAELARRRPSTFLTLTQNVDGLSARAGHPAEGLLCLHGDMFSVRCTSFMCNYREDNVVDDPLTPALKVDEDEYEDESCLRKNNSNNGTKLDDTQEESDKDSMSDRAHKGSEKFEKFENDVQTEKEEKEAQRLKQAASENNNHNNGNRTFPGLAQRYTDLLDSNKDFYYSSSGITDLDDSAYSSSSSACFPNGYNYSVRKKKTDLQTSSSKQSSKPSFLNSNSKNDTPNDKGDNNNDGNNTTNSADNNNHTNSDFSAKPKKRKKFVKKDIPFELLPRCPKCKVGLLRPGVVWFGEPLPLDVLQKADEFITNTNNNNNNNTKSNGASGLDSQKVDLILVIGTSGTVWPAAGYVEQVSLRGGKVAVFNTSDPPSSTAQNDNTSDNVLANSAYKDGWFFQGDAAEVLPKALEPLIGNLKKRRKY